MSVRQRGPPPAGTTSKAPALTQWPARWLIVLLPLFALSCASLNRMGEYDIQNSSLAVVAEFPPYAEILTGPYSPGHPRDPVHAIVRAGTELAREIEARRVRPRLDSACVRVDLETQVGDQIANRVSRYLGTRRVEREADADLVLEVRIRDYGIDAKGWNAAAHFFVDAEAWLINVEDRRPIWKTRVRERDPIAPAIFATRALRNIVTASALADLSVDEIARALEQLASYSADRITDRLRSAYDDARH
jgi:hypothetical protein